MTMLMEDISHPKVLYGKDGEYFACIHQLVEMAGFETCGMIIGFAETCGMII